MPAGSLVTRAVRLVARTAFKTLAGVLAAVMVVIGLGAAVAGVKALVRSTAHHLPRVEAEKSSGSRSTGPSAPSPRKVTCRQLERNAGEQLAFFQAIASASSNQFYDQHALENLADMYAGPLCIGYGSSFKPWSEVLSATNAADGFARSDPMLTRPLRLMLGST